MVFEILKNRCAVRILKTLYNNEVILKKSYSMKLSFIKQQLGLMFPLRHAKLLERHGLIIMDAAENEKALSITEKGKQFINMLDQLIFLMNNKEVKKESIELTYELTDTEKKILLVLFKMQNESGDMVQLKNLTQEICHYKKPVSLSKPIARLEQMGLVYKITKDNLVFLRTTESGEKVINRQLVKEKLL